MKIMPSDPNETPDQRIIRCANNLIKAVLASGRSIHSTPGVSGIDVHVYNNDPHKVRVQCILSGWNVDGYTPLKITFAPAAPDPETLTEDDGPSAQQEDA